MPSINTFITALVAGLTIGVQAGPCRPHAPSSSALQPQVTTTRQVESAAGTSVAYTDAVSISEPGASLSTTVQVTSSTEAESKPESTSVISSLATDSTTESTSSSDEIVSSALPTTAESSAAPYTTSEAEAVPSTTSEAEVIPSTTSSEPKTTLDTSTIAPTTTSAYSTTTTSQASTTSAAASSECPPLSQLSCGLAGLYTNSDSHLIQVLYDTDLDGCWELCTKNDKCKSIGITTADQCEIYDTAVAGMGFSAQEGWYFSVYDACCHQATTE
ncbi:hypothetical protein KAF25_008936 [Fusarium avenaceum]|uniref:Apple domain-containing protein n=1 Tax=Fusarium avenaceum TaxID=40199 RepID=A0A9P7GS00_9HYPO|nr:hypothetical protein KAF25_008936 [Fusarium avenaceum]